MTMKNSPLVVQLAPRLVKIRTLGFVLIIALLVAFARKVTSGKVLTDAACQSPVKVIVVLYIMILFIIICIFRCSNM